MAKQCEDTKDQIDISLENMFDEGYRIGAKQALRSLVKTMEEQNVKNLPISFIVQSIESLEKKNE